MRKKLGARAARQQLRDRAAAATPSSCRATSTARPRSPPASRARSSWWCPRTASWGSRKCPGCPISTTSPRPWVSSCSARRPWPAGRRGAAGSRRGCCSSAATSRATWCSPTSPSCPRTAIRSTRPATRSAPCTRRSRWATTSARATKPVGRENSGEMMAMSNRMADRDEDFNTRYASYRGWQMAVEKVKPIPRTLPQIDLTAMVKAQGLKNTGEVVDYFAMRFMSVPLGSEAAPGADRVPRPGTGHQRRAGSADVDGGSAAHAAAPDHEHAGVSARLRLKPGDR